VGRPGLIRKAVGQATLPALSAPDLSHPGFDGAGVFGEVVAFDKHILDLGEFPGIRTRAQFASHIEDVRDWCMN
jgi:hypothetical protein